MPRAGSEISMARAAADLITEQGAQIARTLLRNTLQELGRRVGRAKR
jgi:hypothetical protein